MHPLLLTLGLVLNLAHAEEPRTTAGAELARETCGRCHALTPDDKSRWGPDLQGIVDRPMGAELGYRYASYLEEQGRAGEVWSDDALRTWLVDSKEVARQAGARTKMPSQELTDEQLDLLIPYLRTL